MKKTIEKKERDIIKNGMLKIKRENICRKSYTLRRIKKK